MRKATKENIIEKSQVETKERMNKSENFHSTTRVAIGEKKNQLNTIVSPRVSQNVKHIRS